MRKNHIITIIISLIAGFYLCLAQAMANDSPFPPLEGELLSSEEVIFPADFKASYHMVIMSFDRDQEKQIEGWIKAASDLPETVSLFEVALIGKVGGIARFFIKGGMRDMEQYKSRKKTVMPYFGDADAIKAALKINDNSQVHAFLITKEGQILWQGKGDYQNHYRQLPPL